MAEVETRHQVLTADARDLADSLEPSSVDLVVTSPPYPMIAMWDELFGSLDSKVGAALDELDGEAAFEYMHRQLDRVWEGLARVVKPGGIVCINIGDATRTVGDRFRLYPNHARVIQRVTDLGFECLPTIYWRKATNSPTKFMGSGMLPVGAYPTLEHEYILVFRKDGKRRFDSPDQKGNRRRSAFFWEERNRWFSDLWDLRGERQSRVASRDRSGAFPFELAFRLVSMFSVYGDTVLDPFLGTGTTSVAAAVAGRHSVGFELVGELAEEVRDILPENIRRFASTQGERLEAHRGFIQERGAVKYHNRVHDVPVVTRQELELQLLQANDPHWQGQDLVVSHKPL